MRLSFGTAIDCTCSPAARRGTARKGAMEYRTFDMDDVLRMRRAILATFLELGFRIAGDEPGDSISCRMAAETSFGKVGVQVTPRGDAQLDVRLEPLGVHDGTAPFPYELFFNSISKRLYLAAHRS